jgi:hypothetical protein
LIFSRGEQRSAPTDGHFVVRAGLNVIYLYLHLTYGTSLHVSLKIFV